MDSKNPSDNLNTLAEAADEDHAVVQENQKQTEVSDDAQNSQAFRDSLTDAEKRRYDELNGFRGKHLHEATTHYKASESSIRSLFGKFKFTWTDFFTEVPSDMKVEITQDELQKFAGKPIYEAQGYFKASEKRLRAHAKSFGINFKSPEASSLAVSEMAAPRPSGSTNTLKRKQLNQEMVSGVQFNVEYPDGNCNSLFILGAGEFSFKDVETQVSDVLDLVKGSFTMEFLQPNGKWCLLKKQVHLDGCMRTSGKNGVVELLVKKV